MTLYSQIVIDVPYGESPLKPVCAFVNVYCYNFNYYVFIGTLLLFNKMKLVTRITSKGLFFRYPPFILKEKYIKRRDLKV